MKSVEYGPEGHGVRLAGTAGVAWQQCPYLKKAKCKNGPRPNEKEGNYYG
jgi:hypothetical protein